MGEIFAAAGQIGAAQISANAARQATAMQLDALARQRQFVFNNLDPALIGPMASEADATNAANRLALQGLLDPNLLSQRYASEADINRRAGEIGVDSGKISQQAIDEATASGPAMTAAKNRLIDAANQQLSLGASLPPDVQAELVKAGLEKTGMVTQNAQGRGVGGNVLRTILGTAGIALQQQRQQQASGLLTAAQNLDTQRQNILQSLFPNLANTQLKNLAGQQGVLQQSNAMLPGGGLSGTDVANLWLARVGATNQISSNAANIAAQGTLAQGNAFANALGALGGGLGGAYNNGTLQNGYNTVSGWFSSPGNSYSYSPGYNGAGDFGGE